MKSIRRSAAGIAVVAAATAGLLAASGILATSANASTPFLGTLTQNTPVASTVPGNGDVNPYGVAVVPTSTGDLVRGDVLVSNFNNLATTANPAGQEGRGTTIVQVNPTTDAVTQFAGLNGNLADCPGGGIGLTTALVVLPSGWVIVGSLPSTDGLPDGLDGAGCLIVLDSHGNVRETFTGDGINGPWDMTALNLGGLTELFVTNVLNGITPAATGAPDSTANEGTVLRILITSTPFAPPRRLLTTQIGSGFPESTDPTALIIGPTGVGLGHNGTLYVADTLDNRIAAIPNAAIRFSDDGTGQTVSENDPTGPLEGPLGLAIAPNGDILTVNGGNPNIVEVTPGGQVVANEEIDLSTPGGAAGDLFGLAVSLDGSAVYYVNDGNNMLYSLSS
jgi:hypothetical protein